jgi:hypothetical protein
MKTPFTVDQFFEVFKNYNQAVFPIQILFYLVSILVVYLTIKPIRNSDKIISIILAFFWMWMGMVYHLVFFTVINKAAYFFGSLFIFQGILFLILGVFQNKLSFSFSFDRYSFTGLILILYALLIYPVLGNFLGHAYPYSPTFGLPCPTTIFTLGLLLLNAKKIPVAILIIPILWSIIGFAAAFSFGIVEDTGLIVAGLLTVSFVLFRNRMLPGKNIGL